MTEKEIYPEAKDKQEQYGSIKIYVEKEVEDD